MVNKTESYSNKVQSIASNIDNAVEDVNIYLSKVKNKKNRKQLKKIQENLSQKKAELIHQSNTLIKNDKTNFTLLNNITNFVGNRNNMIKEIVQQDSIESQKDKKIYINGKAYTKKDIAYHSMKSFGRGIKTLGRYTGIFLLIMMEGVKEQSRDYRAVVANSMNVMGTSIGTSNIMQTASIPNIISPNTTFSLPFSSMPMMPINLPSQNMTARSIDTSPLTMMLLDNLTRPPRPQKRNNFFPAQQQFMPPPPRMTGHNFSQPAAFNKRTIQGTHSIEQSKIDTSDIKELQKLLDKNAEILQNRIQEIDKRKAEEKKNKQGTVQPSLENEKIKTKISEENKQQNNNVSQVIQKNKEEETLLSPHFERGVDNMLKQIRIDFVRDDLKEAVKNVMQSQKMFSTFRYDTGKEDYITKLADIFIETGKAKNLENYILGKIEGKVERKTHFSPDKILTFMNSAQEELANKIAEGLNKHLDVCVKLVEKTDLKTAKSVALIDVVEAIRRSRNLSVREESARNYKLEQLINSLEKFNEFLRTEMVDNTKKLDSSFWHDLKNLHTTFNEDEKNSIFDEIQPVYKKNSLQQQISILSNTLKEKLNGSDFFENLDSLSDLIVNAADLGKYDIVRKTHHYIENLAEKSKENPLLLIQGKQTLHELFSELGLSERGRDIDKIFAKVPQLNLFLNSAEKSIKEMELLESAKNRSSKPKIDNNLLKYAEKIAIMGNSLGYDEEDTKKLYQNLTSMPSEAFDELKQYYDLNYEQHSLHQQQKTLDNNIIVDIETEKSLASNTPIENKRTDFDSLKKNEKAFINQLDNIYDNINLFLEHGADSDTKKDIFQKKLKSLAIGKSLFIPIMLKNEQDEPEMSIIEIYRMKQNPYNTQKDNENYVMSLHSTQHFKLNMEDQNYIPRLLINKKTSGDRSPMKNIKFMMYDLIDQENRQVPLTRGEVLLNDKIVKIQIPEIFAENLAIDFDKNKQLPIINTIIKDDFYHPIPKLTKENDYNSYNAVQNSVIKANAIHFDCEDFVQQLSQQKI